MQAIQTKWLPPTNTLDARIWAKCAAKSLMIAWDDGLGIEDNHRRAATKLALELDWTGTWVSGTLEDGTGVHVCVRRKDASGTGCYESYDVWHGMIAEK